MGANTMVAAIGLVLGPVLGGALVAISWHWVFWFNVPFALAGAAWGALILRELAKPDAVRGYDVLGTTHVRRRPDRPRARRLARRHQRLERPDRDRRPDRRGGAAAAVGGDRAPLARADARPATSSSNRLFAAASAAAFINGLARFALMFLFVFYYQGAQGNSPIDAGIKLIPLALGMLVASPLAGHLRRPPRLARAGRARACS